MEPKLKQLTLFAIINLLNVAVNAQDIKPLDYASLFKKNKITECNILQVRHKNNSKDTILLGHYRLNELGQMIEYREFTSSGNWSNTHFFTYDLKGKVATSAIEFASIGGQKFPFQLNYNAAGQLVSRTLNDCGVNFWQKETYEYNTAKVLIKSVQHYKNESQEIKLEQDYPAQISPKENSLSFIYDLRGLLILHQYYNDQNKVFKSLVYEYK
jgi:hypothetical protein